MLRLAVARTPQAGGIAVRTMLGKTAPLRVQKLPRPGRESSFAQEMSQALLVVNEPFLSYSARAMYLPFETAVLPYNV